MPLPAAALFVCLLALPLSGCGKKKSQDANGHPSPTPFPVLPRKNYDLSKLFSQILLKSSVTCEPSGQTALLVAVNTNSYELDINLHVLWPKAAGSEIGRAHV